MQPLVLNRCLMWGTVLTASLAVALSVSAGRPAPQLQIEARFLEVNRGYTRSLGMNDVAEVVGVKVEPGGSRAFRWDQVHGMVQLEGLSPDGEAEAYGINNAGAVVGRARTGGGWHAAWWSPDGAIHDVHPAGSLSSVLYRINGLGQAVGAAVGEGGRQSPLVSHPRIGEEVVVTVAGGSQEVFVGINDRGQMAGVRMDGAGNQFGTFVPSVNRPDRRFTVVPRGFFESAMLGIDVDGTLYGAGFRERNKPIPLVVKPRIDGTRISLDVRLELDQVAGDIAGTSNGGSAKGGVMTVLRTAEGGQVVLGGLAGSRDALKTTLPFLAETPVLGGLFRRRSDNKNKAELLMFLTPTLLTEPEQALPRDAGPPLPNPSAALVVAHAGPVATDATSATTVTAGAFVPDDTSGDYVRMIRVKAKRALKGPVVVAFRKPDWVRLINPDGATLLFAERGLPFIRLGRGGMARGETRQVKARWSLTAPDKISAEPIVLAGGNL